MQRQSEGKSRRDRPIGAASLSSNDHFSFVPESGKLIVLVPQMSTAPISSSAPQPLRSGPNFFCNESWPFREGKGGKRTRILLNCCNSGHAGHELCLRLIPHS